MSPYTKYLLIIPAVGAVTAFAVILALFLVDRSLWQSLEAATRMAPIGALLGLCIGVRALRTQIIQLLAEKLRNLANPGN